MNAKKEFIDHTQGKKVKCAFLHTSDYYFGDEMDSSMSLKVDYSESDYADFLQKFDYDYDDGFGGQYLYGIIWYDDGTWSSREEYDGAEWWEYHQCPEIYEYIRN